MQPDPFLSSEMKDLLVKVFKLEKIKNGGKKIYLDCPNLLEVELDVSKLNFWEIIM